VVLLLSSMRLSHGWGVLDDVGDAFVGVATDAGDALSNAFNALETSVSDAAQDATEFFKALTDNPDVATIITAIQNVVTLTRDVIEDAVQDFNVATWEKLVDEAKLTIYNLEQHVQQYIAAGCNFLSDLVDADFVPFPLDVVKEDDFFTVTECLADSVFDLAKEWTQHVATTFTNLIGSGSDISSLDFQPMLNTESVRDELNATYRCLYGLANSIQARKEEKQQQDFENVVSEAFDFIGFENLTLTIKISFTVCTLSCGTAALGFAVSADDISLARPFYEVALGVETSSVVGASIGAEMGFYKNFSSVVGLSHAISFGVELPIPFIPDLIPDVSVELSADADSEGDFEGFALAADIIDAALGLNGAFSVGYAISESKWVYTTDDLKELWNAAEEIVDDRIETANAVVNAYQYLTDEVMSEGGYLVKAAQNTETTLSCPSGISESNAENTNIGNLSVLQLGAMDIYQVVFGNVEGQNECNSTSGYDAVRELCQFGSRCTVRADSDTLGNVYCSADSEAIDLTVIYGCPNQLDVFNLGCYAVQFRDVIDQGWYQDYSGDGILDDSWTRRRNGLAKCAKIARDRGYAGFATYNNGMCLMASNLFNEGVYNEFARVNASSIDQCPSDGLGDDIAMNLYAFALSGIAFDDLGCLNESQIAVYQQEYGTNLKASFRSFEGEHYLLQDGYKMRRNANSKCAQIAHEKGYKGFALKDGGECFVSNSFRDSVMNDVWSVTGLTNETQTSCGKGTDYAYNVFQFPYVELDAEQEEGLSVAEIAGIAVGGTLFLVLLGVALFFLCRARKMKAAPKRRSTARSASGKGQSTRSKSTGSAASTASNPTKSTRSKSTGSTASTASNPTQKQ